MQSRAPGVRCMASSNASARGSIFARMFVRELEDGQTVDEVLIVREREARRKRDGAPYLKLVLADAAEPGRAVRVAGTYAVHTRYGPQLTLQGLRAADRAEYTAEDLLDGPARDAAAPEA